MRIGLLPRALIVAATALGAAGTAHVFTASNTVTTSRAGAGSASISGYAITDVSYGINGTTPTDIDSVTFTISPADGTVKAKLSAAGSWYACTNAGGSVTCATTSPQATVGAADTLTVVAVE